MLNDTKTLFNQGGIPKADYIERMYTYHQLLFDYSGFIKDTDIKKIEITDDSVIMTTRTSDVRLLCSSLDQRIAPMEMLNFDYNEREEFNMMLSLVKDGYRVFDVGGNIGWYAITLAKLNRHVNVLVFEPIPKTFNYLIRNVGLNNVSNVEAFNFGFGDSSKEVDFYYYDEGSGNASLANVSGREKVVKVLSRVRRMDEFVEESGVGVDFIKCDVEGAELFVLRGGIESIRRYKPIIFCELLRKWAGKFNYHPNDVLRLLADEGYKCFLAKGGKLVELPTIDDSSWDTNFFFLHGENHSSQIACSSKEVM